MIGFSEGFHDAAVTVINDGRIDFATHAERYSKKKHDKNLGSLLASVAQDYTDDSKIAFFERPLLKKTRQFVAGQYKTVFRRRELAYRPTHYFGHHLSHAAAAFQTSPFHDAAIVVVDSIGEWDTASIWKARYQDDGTAAYWKWWSMRYPKSIGLWYSALTKWAGFRPLDEEYVFMGMAAYGTPCCTEEVRDLLSRNNHRGISSLSSRPENVAKSAEWVLEGEIRKLFNMASQLSPNICYGGGVALNCVVNAKLQKDFSMWIMPNPGDAGASLGAAALTYKKRVDFTPYTGYNIKRTVNPKEVVKILLNKGLVGVANGRAEFGPRSLGNRSLLADPRQIENKNLVNQIKRRQKFRPFAPAILEEHCQEYFEMPPQSRYMSYTYQCKCPDEIPAVIHYDNSARVQTVPIDSESVLRDILEAWYEETGCPVLLNTSLNIRGMPMVNDWNDACQFSKKYFVDVV